MTLKDKINRLNELNNYSFGITFFNEWEASAYNSDAPLSMYNHYPYFKHADIEKLIDMCLEYCESL